MQEFIIPKKLRLRLNYVKGNSEIYSYAKERGIGHNKCGKLIIANNLSEEKILSKIKKNAKKWYFIKVYK